MDPKKILGVDANATDEEIQKAYREKASKHHPDRGGDGWAFQQVQDAYEALTNPAQPKTKSASQEPSTPPTDSPHTKSNPNRANQANRSRRRKNESPAARARKGSLLKKTQNPDSRNVEAPLPEHNWKNLFTGQLPLQTETTFFILVNCLDIFQTYILLFVFKGASESNPIAAYIMGQWGFGGAIAFKLAIVAFVVVVAQIVAIKKLKTARFLLIAGTVMVTCVVAYSVLLYFIHI